jgi:RNA polymerase sigma factor (TIGR02999 family)
VYDDLRHVAGRLFKRQRRDHTLQPTVLVHEAYMRLVRPQDQGFENRRHFMRVATLAMRQLLTDYARARASAKRGGGEERVALEEAEEAGADEIADDAPAAEVDLVELDKALTKLRELEPRQADIVELRFLGGLTVAEVADVLQVGERTVYVDWGMARVWLKRELGGPAA